MGSTGTAASGSISRGAFHGVQTSPGREGKSLCTPTQLATLLHITRRGGKGLWLAGRGPAIENSQAYQLNPTSAAQWLVLRSG